MKTTNPALIKRFFKGELEPGDHSKDFIIEPDYALVFNGKISHRTNPVKVTVSWRDRSGVFWQRFVPSAIRKLIDEKVSKDAKIIYSEDYMLSSARMMFFQLAQANRNDVPDVDKLIKDLNVLYIGLRDKEKFWNRVKENQRAFQRLWGGDFSYDLTGLDPDFSVFLMERRIENE